MPSDKNDLRKVLGFSAGFYPTVIEGDKNLQHRAPVGNLSQDKSRWVGSQAGNALNRFIEIKGVGGSSSHPYITDEGWPIAGNPVWYKSPTNYKEAFKTIEEDIRNQKSYADHLQNIEVGSYSEGIGPKLEKFYGGTSEEFELGRSLMKGTGGGTYDDVPLNARIVDEVIENYLEKVSHYSGKYLKNMADKVMRDIGKEKAHHLEPGEIEMTEGAHPQVQEEQTKVMQPYLKDPNDNWYTPSGGPTEYAAAVSPYEAGKTAGRTQNIDTFFNINGQLISADVTHSPIWQHSQHGITDVPKHLKEENVQKLLKSGEEGRGELKKNIFDYFQDQILVYNEGIDKIRRQAHKAHAKQGEAFGDWIQQTATPSDLRAPFKPAQHFMDTKSIQLDRFRSVLQKVKSLYVQPPGVGASKNFGLKNDPEFRAAVAKTKAEYEKGAQASLSASWRNVMVGLYGGFGSARKRKARKQILTSRGMREVNTQVMKFILHSLGTWSQHGGQYWNAFRISSKGQDLVTAGVNLRMWRSTEKKYLYKKLRSVEEDVRIYNGYFTHGLMAETGWLKEGDTMKLSHDQAAAQTSLQLGKKTGTLTMNRVNSSEVNRLAGRGDVGFSFILYNNTGQAAALRMHRAIHKMFGGGQRTAKNREQEQMIKTFGSSAASGVSGTGSFATELGRLQANARDENNSNVNRYHPTNTTWPGKSWITALQYFGLQQHRVGTTGVGKKGGYAQVRPPK